MDKNRRRSRSSQRPQEHEKNNKGVITEFEKMSFSSTYALLLGIACLQLQACIAGHDEYMASNALGSAICLIAGYHYDWMRRNIDSSKTIHITRYADWIITTQLMLVDFFTLSHTLTSRWYWLLGSCITCLLMLFFGYMSKHQKSFTQFVIGCLFGLLLVACFCAGTIRENHPNNWMFVFAAVWILYPFAFFSKNQTFFNILDIVSKGMFGITTGLIALM